MKFRAVILATAFLALASLAHAQTAIIVQPGEKLRLMWEHDGLFGAQFRLYLDGVVIKNFVAADLTSIGPAAPGGDITFTTVDGVVPTFTDAQLGFHKFEIAAYNGGGESNRMGLAFDVNYVTIPNPPKGLRMYGVKLVFNDATGMVKVILVEERDQP